VSESAEILEHRIGRLRAAVREAVLAADKERASALRRELKQAEQAWEDALDHAEALPSPGTTQPGSPETVPSPLIPLREQVYQALSLLTVPAAPKLLATVHQAFFASTFPTAKVTSLKRDEERSFRTAPFARPYYICATLTADLLAPARGLLAASTWPMERRVIGPLSPRVDFLSAAIQVAGAIGRLPTPVPAASRLLWRFAASIPGAAQDATRMDPRNVAEAAVAELSVHRAADSETRQAAAVRARAQLDDVEQLFGTRLAAADQRRGG